MRRSLVLAAALAALVFPSSGQIRCGVAKDLVVQALENLKSSPATSEIEDGVQLLKQAAQQCPTLGDAWYYRSLFEAKLGRGAQAAFAMRQAKLMGSEAMESGIDPFTLAAPPDGGRIASGSEPVRDKWALVVGISKFRNGIDMLAHTRQDAEDFARLLKSADYGRFREDHVRLLSDADATTANIRAGLNWIARSADAADLAVVFLSSHGTARQKDSVGGLNYLLTHDTDASNEDKLYGSALAMVDVSDIISSRVRARRTAVFLDTCHSGGALKRSGLREAAPAGRMLDKMRAGVGRVIIASSQEGQASWESERFDNGIFTYFLLEALKQQNGLAPISAVYEYLKQRVAKQVMTEHRAVQMPVMMRSEQGADIVLGVNATSLAANPIVISPQSAFISVDRRLNCVHCYR